MLDLWGSASPHFWPPEFCCYFVVKFQDSYISGLDIVTDAVTFKVTVNKIWSKFSKIHILALELEKAFKLNLLKTKLQNLKNSARYVGKSIL